MPLTANASDNIRELAHAHPEWSQARRVAAGLNAARRAGGKVKKADKPMKPRELMGK